MRTQKTKTNEAQSQVKSLQMDLKIQSKDAKLKDDKLAELKREISELQKQKVDKIESIKKLQQMLAS